MIKNVVKVNHERSVEAMFDGCSGFVEVLSSMQMRFSSRKRHLRSFVGNDRGGSHLM